MLGLIILWMHGSSTFDWLKLKVFFENSFLGEGKIVIPIHRTNDPLYTEFDD